MAASTRSIHSRQRAAGGRSASSTSRPSSRSRRRRRGAALTGRTAGTPAAPESSRAAPSATSRSNSRRAARSVIGAWRAASAGETQSSASSRSTILAAGLARSLGATAMQGVRAAGKVSGEVEGGGGGQRDRARGGFRPGRLARPRPPTAVRHLRPGPEFSWRSAARAAASAAGWRGRCRTPKGQGFRLRPLGRPGRRKTPGPRPCAAAETGSPSPAQAFRPDARPFGSTARSSRAAASASRPASRLGGRPARSRHS